MRTFTISLLGTIAASLLAGCGAHGGSSTTTTGADIHTGPTLEQKGAWTNVAMPDGTSVEDYAVGSQYPETAGAAIYVVSRVRSVSSFRDDLTVSMSSDFGRTFLKLATIHDAPRNAHIAVAPSDDRNVIVTAGGLSTGMSEADSEGMLWRSTDGGVTFTKSAAPDTPVRIDIDPADAKHLVGATCSGLFRSLDGGATFARVPGDSGIDYCNSAELYRSQKSRDVMYVLYSSGEGGSSVLRRTTNGAGTWETVAYGSAMSGFAIHPNDPNHVYVLDAERGWISSADGGKTFNPHSAALDKGAGAPGYWSSEISNVAFDTYTAAEPSLYLVNTGRLKRWAPGGGPEGGTFVGAFTSPPAQLDELRFETVAESGKDGSPIVGLIGIAGQGNDTRTLAVSVFWLNE